MGTIIVTTKVEGPKKSPAARKARAKTRKAAKEGLIRSVETIIIPQVAVNMNNQTGRFARSLRVKGTPGSEYLKLRTTLRHAEDRAFGMLEYGGTSGRHNGTINFTDDSATRKRLTRMGYKGNFSQQREAYLDDKYGNIVPKDRNRGRKRTAVSFSGPGGQVAVARVSTPRKYREQANVRRAIATKNAEWTGLVDRYVVEAIEEAWEVDADGRE